MTGFLCLPDALICLSTCFVKQYAVRDVTVLAVGVVIFIHK